MSAVASEIRLGAAVYRPAAAAVEGGFETIDGERFAVIRNVDHMAPFLMNHPALLHAWMEARETALARVRSLPTAQPGSVQAFHSALTTDQSSSP